MKKVGSTVTGPFYKMGLWFAFQTSPEASERLEYDGILDVSVFVMHSFI